MHNINAYRCIFSYTPQTKMYFFYCTFVRSIHTRCARLVTFSLCLPLFRSSLVQYTCTRVYFLTVANLCAYFIFLFFISYVITISRTHSENMIISNTPVVLLRNLRKEWIAICCELTGTQRIRVQPQNEKLLEEINIFDVDSK